MKGITLDFVGEDVVASRAIESDFAVPPDVQEHIDFLGKFFSFEVIDFERTMSVGEQVWVLKHLAARSNVTRWPDEVIDNVGKNLTWDEFMGPILDFGRANRFAKGLGEKHRRGYSSFSEDDPE